MCVLYNIAYIILYYIIFAGDFQIGDNIKPLDPKTVGSIVQYGRYGRSISQQAVGYSLIYNQLYPFKGLQNYTSGIIHHVRLTGIIYNITLALSFLSLLKK